MKSHVTTSTSERILFSTVGTRPFQDWVFSIRADGKDLQPLLAPEPTRSYFFASAHSLSGPILVSARETVQGDDGKVADRLYIYSPGAHRWRPVLPASAPQTAAILSPDGNQAVYRTVGKSGGIDLALLDLHDGESRLLFSEDGTRVASPAWAVSGKIAFLRLFRSPSGGLLTELMQVPTVGGNPIRLLPSHDGVVCATYSPDGGRIAVWTKNGLEILADHERRLVFKWNPAIDGSFRSWGIGGLAWSKRGDEIAFALLKQKTGQSELWVVNQTGANPRKIYSTKEGRIIVSEFVD